MHHIETTEEQIANIFTPGLSSRSLSLETKMEKISHGLVTLLLFFARELE